MLTSDRRGLLLSQLTEVLSRLRTKPITSGDGWWLVTSLAENSSSMLPDLISQIHNTPEFDPLTSGLQMGPMGGLAVSPEHLAAWLIERATKTTPNQAIADAEAFTSGEELEFLWVVPIDDIVPNRRVDLNDGLALVPWNEVPESDEKQVLSVSLPAAGVFRLPPTAALVISDKWRITSRDPSITPSGAQPIPHFDRLTYALNAVACLTLFGPSSPAILSYYCLFASSVPLLSPTQTFLSPRESWRRTEWREEWRSEAAEVIAAFESTASTRKHIRIAVDRLNASLRTLQLVDRAIDLGIALESTFLSDQNDDRGELGFRLRLRAARFLAAEPTERKRLTQLISKAYTVRSVAAHTGDLPSVVRGMRPEQIISETSTELARALRRLILVGTPDWDLLCLS